MSIYNAIIHEAEEGGYWAEVPDLPGCVTEADTLDATTFGPAKTLVSSTAPLAAMPTLSFVASDGTLFTDEKGIWHLLLTDGGRTLKFGPMRGTQILLK